MANDFVKSPMDWDSGPVNPKHGGTMNGEPGLEGRSAHPGGVDEVTYEDFTQGGTATVKQVGVPIPK